MYYCHINFSNNIEMWHILLFVLVYLKDVYSYREAICESGHKIGSCSRLILGHNISEFDTCTVEHIQHNSPACRAMYFGPIESNAHLGDITLKAHLKSSDRRDDSTTLNHNRTGELTDSANFNLNNTVLVNVTFSNIKWKTMKFRFQVSSNKKIMNQCSHIVIADDAAPSEHATLYYDCYGDFVENNVGGPAHALDFEAADDRTVSRGQFYFNMPSSNSLKPTVTEKEWEPFVYIEILETSLKLHIAAPPAHLDVGGARVRVLRECGAAPCEVRNASVRFAGARPVAYEYGLLRSSGAYYFVVTPLHARCDGARSLCRHVRSPVINISNEHQTLNICIASVTALVVGALFAYYVLLRLARRYWCRDYRPALAREVPPPTSVLVVYPPAVKLHAQCVASLVEYLRAELGLRVAYEGDVGGTAHGDPFEWAHAALAAASHVLYVVGPSRRRHIYDGAVPSAYRDVDRLLLSLLRADRLADKPKEIANVFLEHSDGEVPLETRHARTFFLMRDWNKLVAYLSNNLLPRQQITRTEKGRCFFEDLKRAKKSLCENGDLVIIDKNFEKKILL